MVDAMSSPPATLFIEVREGLAAATVPGDVVSALEGAARDSSEAADGIETAALIVLRLGNEAGGTLLRHVVRNDPRVILQADPLFNDALAHNPESIVGPLAGTPPCKPV
jgi:hypothetical protein